jgi:hypothetical protein
MGRAWSTHGRDEKFIQIFGLKPEGRRLFGRPMRRLEDNIRMDLREWGLNGWTGCTWLRIGNSGGSFENGNETLNCIRGRVI